MGNRLCAFEPVDGSYLTNVAGYDSIQLKLLAISLLRRKDCETSGSLLYHSTVIPYLAQASFSACLLRPCVTFLMSQAFSPTRVQGHSILAQNQSPLPGRFM